MREIIIVFSPLGHVITLRATNMKNVSQPSDIIKHFNYSPSLSPQPFTMFQLVKWSACSVESQIRSKHIILMPYAEIQKP